MLFVFFLLQWAQHLFSARCCWSCIPCLEFASPSYYMQCRACCGKSSRPPRHTHTQTRAFYNISQARPLCSTQPSPSHAPVLVFQKMSCCVVEGTIYDHDQTMYTMCPMLGLVLVAIGGCQRAGYPFCTRNPINRFNINFGSCQQQFSLCNGCEGAGYRLWTEYTVCRTGTNVIGLKTAEYRWLKWPKT